MNRSINLFYILTLNLIILNSASCKNTPPSSDISAFHKDKNSGERRLVDTGIYVDSRSTTTAGEIFSDEFSSSRWSGDTMIHRDETSYNTMLHAAISPGGLFYFKAKALKQNKLAKTPSVIEIVEGTLVQDPNGCESADESPRESLNNDVGSTLDSLINLRDPQQRSPTQEENRNQTSNTDQSLYQSNQASAEQNGGFNRNSNTNLDQSNMNYPTILYQGKEITDPSSYSLCTITDSVIRRGSPHGPNMTVFSLAIKPSKQGAIHIRLKWKHSALESDSGSTNAEFDINVRNLRDRNFDEETTVNTTIDISKKIPEYQNCNDVSTCTDAPEKSAQMRRICEEMNQMIDPLYSFRHQETMEPWHGKEKELSTISSSCGVEVFLARRKRGVEQPAIFRHSSHGLNAYLGNTLVKADFADLRMAKAITKSLKSVKETFGVTGFRYSGIYNYRRIKNDRGSSKKLSRHANAMAIDISRFIMKDGTTVPVTSYHSNPILRKIKNHLCQYFRVVLGPEYNKVHHNHFHLALHPTALTDYDIEQPRFAALNPKPSGQFSLLGSETEESHGSKSEMLHPEFDDDAVETEFLGDYGVSLGLTKTVKINTVCK